MECYDTDFYEGRDALTRFAAETVLSIVQRAIPGIRSAVDIGCGVGTWLSVLRERGVSEILGIDGHWVDTQSLVIPSECFHQQNLGTEDVHLGRRYDLVICLEVAEHLSAERAVRFVTQLTELGDVVLFSAAIPGQGGTNHVNEQWPEYWVELFGGRNYRAFDIIRRHIWSDNRIAVHYRQNTLLFVKNERAAGTRIENEPGASMPLSVVHPQLYLNKIQAWRSLTVRQSLELFAVALAKRMKRQLGM